MKYVALVVLIVLNSLLLFGSLSTYQEQTDITASYDDEFITWEATSDNVLEWEPQEMMWLEMREGEIIYFDGNKHYKLVLMEGGK